MTRIIKRILIICTITILIIFGISLIRYDQSQKYYSQDGQYSFYSKRSVFSNIRMSMPGNGDAGGGTIYIYDEIENKVIFQFESSWIRSDMDASEFTNYNGGSFICKSGYWFNLPRPIQEVEPKRIDNKIKSGINVRIKGSLQDAQKIMHFSRYSDKGKFGYYIKVPEKKLSIRTAIIIAKKDNHFLNITLDSILDFTIHGNTIGYWHKPKKEDIEYSKKLTKIEIEDLFREQIIKQSQ